MFFCIYYILFRGVRVGGDTLNIFIGRNADQTWNLPISRGFPTESIFGVFLQKVVQICFTILYIYLFLLYFTYLFVYMFIHSYKMRPTYTGFFVKKTNITLVAYAWGNLNLPVYGSTSPGYWLVSQFQKIFASIKTFNVQTVLTSAHWYSGGKPRHSPF